MCGHRRGRACPGPDVRACVYAYACRSPSWNSMVPHHVQAMRTWHYRMARSTCHPEIPERWRPCFGRCVPRCRHPAQGTATTVCGCGPLLWSKQRRQHLAPNRGLRAPRRQAAPPTEPIICPGSRLAMPMQPCSTFSAMPARGAPCTPLRLAPRFKSHPAPPPAVRSTGGQSALQMSTECTINKE